MKSDVMPYIANNYGIKYFIQTKETNLSYKTPGGWIQNALKEKKHFWE